MCTFTTPQDFRIRSTEEDRLQLRNFYYQSKNKKQDFESDTCPYGFSPSAALSLLKEYGLDADSRAEDPEGENGKSVIFLDGREKMNCIQKTVYFSKETWALYEQLCSEYPAYERKYILDKVMQAGLKRYINLNSTEE